MDEEARQILQQLLEVMQQVRANTSRTATQISNVAQANQPLGTAPPQVESNISGVFRTSAARKALGVRGARALGYRLPAPVRGRMAVVAGMAGGAAGSMLAGIVNKLLIKPAAAGIGGAFDEARLFGWSSRSARVGIFRFMESLPLSKNTVPEIGRALRQGAARVSGVTALVARGMGKIDPAMRQALLKRFMSEELLAARENMKVKSELYNYIANLKNPKEMEKMLFPEAREAARRILNNEK